MDMSVRVIQTTVANTASIMAAFERLGVRAVLTCDPGEVRSASAVVLPGVGSFATAMAYLRNLKLDTAIVDRVQADRPLLAICLGMQLLFEGSEESPDCCGLGIIPDTLQRFASSLRCPHMGWNQVVPENESEILRTGYAYFAHSYHLTQAPTGWQAATTQHGEKFIAALQRGALMACQFHPELSGYWGLKLIERWLQRTQGDVLC